MNNISHLSKNRAILISSQSNLFYCSNWANPDAMILIIDGQYVYITDRRYEESCSKYLQNIVVEIIKPGETYLSAAINLIKAKDIDKVAIEECALTVKDYISLEKSFSEIEFISNDFIISRRKKHDDELRKIRASQRITEEVFGEFLEYIKAGLTEKDCALFIKNRFYHYGAIEAFDTIVAFSENSSLPHATPTDKELRCGDSILIDFGAKLDGYCSDMTRTFCYKDVKKDFVECYNLVYEAQIKAISGLKVGIKCRDLDQIAREVFNTKGYLDNFKHSLGHGVGIDIHEAPYLSYTSTDILNYGDVVTIEPGLYFDNKFGIRIEDMLFLSQIGVENLTNTSKELIIIG